MKSVLIAVAVVVLLGAGYLFLRPGDRLLHEFDRTQLSDLFHAEGGAVGDVNGDGVTDVVAGPFWYEGPDFQVRHAFREPETFDPLDYSDTFIVEVYDFSGDGRTDILVIGFPGEAAHWFEQPDAADGIWREHLAYAVVDNESPHIRDITGDGRPEMVFMTDGYLGYATFDPERPAEPWTFHPISEQREWGRFTHGLGVGDVNGDGRPDVLTTDGWWENPGFDVDGAWDHHPVEFARSGAQMHVFDVDGDGLGDVVTSIDAHGWGVAWYRQEDDGRFERSLIMGEEDDDSPYGIRFSQPHAIAVADIDGDGLQDIVTGKRWWAHGDSGDPEPNAAPVLYWFELTRSEDGSASFIPHLIDDASGIGVDIIVDHIDADTLLDLLIVNKRGTFLFNQSLRQVSASEWQSAQPQFLTQDN